MLKFAILRHAKWYRFLIFTRSIWNLNIRSKSFNTNLLFLHQRILCKFQGLGRQQNQEMAICPQTPVHYSRSIAKLMYPRGENLQILENLPNKNFTQSGCVTYQSFVPLNEIWIWMTGIQCSRAPRYPFFSPQSRCPIKRLGLANLWAFAHSEFAKLSL